MSVALSVCSNCRDMPIKWTHRASNNLVSSLFTLFCSFSRLSFLTVFCSFLSSALCLASLCLFLPPLCFRRLHLLFLFFSWFSHHFWSLFFFFSFLSFTTFLLLALKQAFFLPLFFAFLHPFPHFRFLCWEYNWICSFIEKVFVVLSIDSVHYFPALIPPTQYFQD